MMKKLVSLLLALVMAVGLCVNVWAEGEKPQTGTVKKVEELQKVDEATDDDLAAAKAFLGENGWFVYYEEGNQIMPHGVTSFQDADFKTKMSEAAGAYTSLSNGAKAILETLYVSDGQRLCKFSERVDSLKAYADSIGAGGTDPGPGGEQGGQVDIDEALKDAGYTAPVLRTEGNSGDFYITFPDELKRGTDYEYNYANGVLTVTVLKGSEKNWLAAAKSTNNGSVGYTLHFVKPENAARIAKFNGNNDQAAYQFINGNMAFNGVGDEQAFGGVMAAVNQSGDVLSVTATPNFNGMRSFVVWAAGAESEEAGQNTPIKKLAIRAEIVIEKENYFHYETISQPINDVVEASRLTSGAELNTTYKNTWECAALEPGVLIVRPTGGKTVEESLNTSTNVHLGTVTITAPSGYTLVLNECKVLNGNNAAISENSNTDGDSKCVVSLIALNGHVGRAQYELAWKDAAGNIKRERFFVRVEDGVKLSGLGTGNKPISVPKQSDVITPAAGVNVAYSEGHFYTSFDSSAQLPSDQELEKGITLKPDVSLQGVTHYRVMSVTGGSSALEGEMEILNAFNTMFNTVDPNAVKEYNSLSVGPDLQMRYVEVAYQDIGGVTVGYTSMLGYRHMAAEWLKQNDDGTYEVLGYTYVCGRNDSFVQTTITDAESSEKNAEKPYIIGNEGEKFKCDRYPQRGEGKDKQYFQFTLIGGQERENGKYVVYVPYAYFDMTTADGAARKARGEHPTIKHYYNNHEFREEFEGEYTEYGIKFEVSSFSPFVISTAAQSSSGGGYYYYGGASTPGISAVKTADAAKSATDYTSGIYGLTFRSTAAFSGFKGVQVDGRTIAAANYVAEDNGGIEVYLKAVYLRTLKDGRHTVTILSDAGNVTMNFTIGGVDSPTTFDAGIGAYIGMALASVGGMAWMRRRKR